MEYPEIYDKRRCAGNSKDRPNVERGSEHVFGLARGSGIGTSVSPAGNSRKLLVSYELVVAAFGWMEHNPAPKSSTHSQSRAGAMNCPHCNAPNPDHAETCSQCGAPIPLADAATLQFVDPTVLSPGSDFGPRYRIESLLGQGGMGRVYKAYDKILDRMVAIKVVRTGMMDEADALKRFKQELLLASKISHRNVLRIHDMGEVGNVRFISMAYVEGDDLHDILRKSPKLTIERALKFATQLAGALAAAHAEGVVHRDLKPQNILVSKDDQIFVSDFGLAKSFEEGAVGMTRTGAFMGTPRYMSPEQVEGKPADPRSDLYAYGLILYEMVTGDVPFTGDSTLKVMYQRIREKPKNPKSLNPSVPDWLARIIMRCIERNPDARYQTASEILADLQGNRSSSGASRTVQIQIPQFKNAGWLWGIGGFVAIGILAFAIPPVRHMILGGGNRGASVSAVPPLSSGHFVAVLPFQILGDESQLGYLAQGIEEALSAKLFQLRDVRVTSVDAAGKVDQKQSLARIARALGANLLVQGMLQGSGDKIRVILKLHDVADGKELWSQEFDGVVGDLFTVEDQIYSQLVSALRVTPTNDELAKAGARPTENVAAYDLYLRGRNALRSHDSKSIQSALDYFTEALKDDSTFALAYTGIATASMHMYGVKKDSFWIQKALAAAQQAQTLNDNLPEVHSVLGSVYIGTGKYSEAIAELKRALALAPNADDSYRRLGKAYLASGNGAQAVEAFQRAIQLNPYYWGNQNDLGNAFFQLADYSKALQAFQQVTVLEPDIDAGYENVGNVYLAEGKYQDCIPYFQRALQIEPFWSTYSNLGTAYFFLKQYANSAEMFEKASGLNPNDTTMMVNLADAYRWSGLQDKARAAYQRSISLGYKELETNPQDAAVMAQMALSYAKIGNVQQAESFIRRVRAIDKNNVSYIYDEAEIDAWSGQTTQALVSLREAFEKHYPAEYAAGDPELESLRNNPEFAHLIKQYSAKDR
jgi:eukaryotic-like serine/threonine-protein kinase